MDNGFKLSDDPEFHLALRTLDFARAFDSLQPHVRKLMRELRYEQDRAPSEFAAFMQGSVDKLPFALAPGGAHVAAEVFADLIILIAHESERQRIPTAEAVVQKLKVLAGRVER